MVVAEAMAAAITHINVTIQGETPAPEEVEEGQRAEGEEEEFSSGARCWSALVCLGTDDRT